MFSTARSPLARLVLFMVCLSIAGSAIAAVHYYAIDLPAQKVPMAPENSVCRIVIDLPMALALTNTGEWWCQEIEGNPSVRTFRCCMRKPV